ncbi:MAG: hypothetical protein ABR974_00935 [Bacteroidales bacterium]|jgi:hypothetical protein
MKAQINLIDELSSRVYNKIAEPLFIDFLMNGNPLMEVYMIVNHIEKNLDDYLSTEEQKQLIINNLSAYNDEEKGKSTMIHLAIAIAACDVHTAIEMKLTD